MVGNVMHRNALHEFLQLERPFTELRSLVLSFPYDYMGGSVVVLTRKHIAHALQRLIDGAISADDLEGWAELIEDRPGIEYESGMEEQLSEVLFQLSTPEINEPNTTEKCWRLLKQLR